MKSLYSFVRFAYSIAFNVSLFNFLRSYKYFSLKLPSSSKISASHESLFFHAEFIISSRLAFAFISKSLVVFGGIQFFNLIDNLFILSKNLSSLKLFLSKSINN